MRQKPFFFGVFFPNSPISKFTSSNRSAGQMTGTVFSFPAAFHLHTEEHIARKTCWRWCVFIRLNCYNDQPHYDRDSNRQNELLRSKHKQECFVRIFFCYYGQFGKCVVMDKHQHRQVNHHNSLHNNHRHNPPQNQPDNLHDSQFRIHRVNRQEFHPINQRDNQ